MSDSSSIASDSPEQITPKTSSPVKRKASGAGLDGTSTGRPVKRRASKACQCCRARKVRCNVTEHGAPCTNCRLDEVDCIVSESRRKKKWTKEHDDSFSKSAVPDASTAPATATATAKTIAPLHHHPRALAQRRDTIIGLSPYPHSVEPRHLDHVPHSIYQSHSQRANHGFQDYNRRMSMGSATVPSLSYSIAPDVRPSYLPTLAPKLPATLLPLYMKPLPPKIGPDEISYLEKKGALTVPSVKLRNELLSAYIDYVHPYMPLLELHDFLAKVDRDDGTAGQVSLILFQAVMFAGSAFVDMSHLRAAGYATRKEARKDFFQRTRLLYDFDYDSDRVSLVQALLLLTYYYETPDDQKDTWHWMGVATSVAYTIGLHRNPEKSSMDLARVRLWKRIWWSTYMRDRLIALGMRRPTRIKDQDADVPMLTMDDFEISAVPDSISCIPPSCQFARNVDKQRELAVMCIEKAKLCVLISLVLSKQYCVLNNQQGLANDRTTMMLLPKQTNPEKCEVKDCDEELQRWVDELPFEARYTETLTGENVNDLHKSLLHMTYFTTLSALHRPQVLPAMPVANPSESDPELLEISKLKVRQSATALTSIASQLDQRDLIKYLPTTGVTCLLPAIIIHLLDIKSTDEETRRASLRGFTQCMQVMGKLRELYAAADYSVAFLEAAIRKAGIQLPTMQPTSRNGTPAQQRPTLKRFITVEDLVNAGRSLDQPTVRFSDAQATPGTNLTPPPDSDNEMLGKQGINPNMLSQGADLNTSDEEVARRLESFLASTPPSTDGSEHDTLQPAGMQMMKDYKDFGTGTGTGTFTPNMLNPTQQMMCQDIFTGLGNELEDIEFDSLLNLDAVGGETFASFAQENTMMPTEHAYGEMDWTKVLAS
ncbi:hypothetical protein EJ05DRAFT_194395 [Pseudovirgaria hyperparasitica]|uniref:Zn(2)-C6 fungal-type domain-containing protein n=1 Tax=Pseudovirgaria hyperparasitica TaxID=470096 RepID=A0A6A6WJL7_9PEZI|nr:uncharacterized protein EJ05DRAFT_194395 [Pseudovirgaria hyperparasitica]KAF2762017.1 hypothetical protein EJ05DRAFT_194395 [Pseudovirgaria hyperparasitica]